MNKLTNGSPLILEDLDISKLPKKTFWPTLYKKTSTGAIQFWTIASAMHGAGYGRIETTYGQLGTDSPQYTEDVIEEGKNVGKKNETSAYEQAQKEAEARWKKQKKKGYVESKEAAEAGELDALIEGGIVPMLAHSFTDHGHKIKYPAYVQPKLDGIRCIAVLKDGKCTLWSRTRKPITSMPHIVGEIEAVFGKSKELIFDGELYNHEFKNNFEHIVSLVRQEEPADNHKDVQYHIYDVVKERPFSDRARVLNILSAEPSVHLRYVPTIEIQDEGEVMANFQVFKNTGYEGAMLRNADGLYVNKRSYDLQKVKEFDDAEFEIIGIDEGRGKLAGHVGAFICRMSNGKEFLAKMSGDTGRLRDYFLDPSSCIGKKLTVKYQGLTGKEGVPRFPVGVAIRDYE
jgi:DNA ligase 1